MLIAIGMGPRDGTFMVLLKKYFKFKEIYGIILTELVKKNNN